MRVYLVIKTLIIKSESYIYNPRRFIGVAQIIYIERILYLYPKNEVVVCTRVRLKIYFGIYTNYMLMYLYYLMYFN